MEKIEEIRQRILNQISISQDISDEEIYDRIDEELFLAFPSGSITARDRLEYRKDLFHSIRGLDLLQGLLDDEEITEIMVNGKDHIFVEKKGQLFETDKHFASEARLDNVIQKIVGRVNRRVNESKPIVDARLLDGSRVNIVLAPIALEGSAITIRKFPKEVITMDQLIQWGSISKEAAEFLKDLVVKKYNIFISGGTGAGKTTFLNALTDYIPKDERLITIEDSAELQIRGIKNLVRLECREANSEGENAITMRNLVVNALRMRPSRLIIGEVRSGEAFDLIAGALNTGHSGSISTGHANSAKDMLKRLETMMLMAVDIPIYAIRSQIASAVDILIHLGRMPDKTRKLLAIEEVCDIKDGEIQTNPLFRYEKGGLKKVGELQKKKDC